jgi:hypothetical protein
LKIQTLLLLALALSPVRAGGSEVADARSMDQTVAWIKQHLIALPNVQYQVTVTSGPVKGTSWKSTNTYRDFEINNCELTYQQTNQKDTNKVRSFLCKVPLWDVASAVYKLDDGSEGTRFLYSSKIPELVLRTRSTSIRWIRQNGSIPANEADIQFGSDPKFGEDTIKELARSFMHAASLCSSFAPKAGPAQNPPGVQVPTRPRGPNPPH